MGEGAGVLRVYGHLLRGHVRSQASYRASFVIEVFSNVSSTVFDLMTVLVLFRVTGVLGGFPLRDVVLIIGLSSAAFAVADLVLGNVRLIGRYVRTGLLDAVLVRPLAVLPQVALADMPLRKLSRAVFAFAVWLAALAIADIDWTPARVALAVVAPLAGVVFFGSMFVATASLSFWWIDAVEVSHAFTYGGKDFTAYPITVYGEWFRRVFAYGLGFAFVAYYPALALLGRPDPLGLPTWVAWASPAVALVAAAAAGLAWRAGVRQYRSTGS